MSAVQTCGFNIVPYKLRDKHCGRSAPSASFGNFNIVPYKLRDKRSSGTDERSICAASTASLLYEGINKPNGSTRLLATKSSTASLLYEGINRCRLDLLEPQGLRVVLRAVILKNRIHSSVFDIQDLNLNCQRTYDCERGHARFNSILVYHKNFR